jgi:hypothetical protein
VAGSSRVMRDPWQRLELIGQTRRDGYPGRVGSSSANATWCLGSSRTDFVNRGSRISPFMPAIVVLAGLLGFPLAGPLGCLPLFLIQPY